MFVKGHHSFWSEDNFHTLEITSANLEDAGTYRVTAQNIHGSITCQGNLVVDQGIRAYKPPKFVVAIEPDTIKLTEGQELRLSGRIEAYPAVGLTWYRDKVSRQMV